MSSPDINYPQQPTYGEGMADAMEAQMQMLLGTGEFADIYSDAGFEGGDLATIMREVEAPLRQQTAQVDTDVLRQTLLGSTTGGEEQEVTYDDQGRLVRGFREAPSYTIRTRNVDREGNPVVGKSMRTGKEVPWNKEGYNKLQLELVSPDGEILEKVEHVSVSKGGAGSAIGAVPAVLAAHRKMNEKIQGSDKLPADYKKTINDNIERSGGYLNGTNFDNNNIEDNFTSPIKESFGEGTPIYAVDESGEIIQDITKAGMTEVRTLPPQREGDGLVDLLGDRREIVDYQTRQATEADVAAGLATEVGESITEAVQTGRQAGFSETGEFQGAAALAEDIQAGNLSRQRERDISDVERLSGRFQNIMDEFKPAAATGIQGAKDLIEEQKDKLTSAGGTITIPKGDTFGGELGAVTVADPNTLSANTQFGGEAGLAQSGGTDSLRSALLADAKGALSDGLTDREKARISEAFKGQSTMMGRTFDQSAGIAEAQARTLEDRNRQMQNRAFAQSALGQESGLQQGDIARGMGQELDQANLQQRTDLAQADIDTRQGIIDQGQRQQANQFGVGATMDAERLNEQLRQQGLANYIGAVGNLAQIEDQYTLDPFRAILGRGGGGSLSGGQGVLGSASYGLQSGPQYLNPEAGLGYISQMAANNASTAAAQAAAGGSATSGLLQGLGTIGGAAIGAFCWVAREVYGPTNPSWLRFRMWMFSESPDWFFKLYGQYGERFASWISDKPRIKSFIRKWMDSKIKE